jgi:nicotinamidase-related amidase
MWDMQYGIAQRVFNFTELLTNARHLIDTAHSSGVPVIYTQHTALPYEYMSKYRISSFQRRGIDPKSHMVENTHDWQIIEDLSPQKQDLVIKKNTRSFFVGTPVDQLLRAKSIETLILAGVATEGGIESTARHASDLGFFPVIVEDAVGSHDKENHDIALKLMKKMFDVRRSDEIIGILKRKLSR